MEPLYFASPSEWRKWLARHHARHDEVLVGFHRVATGRPTLTWSESVDEALCFGWIDGIRKRIDETRYVIRFTPRRAGSFWSRVNIAKAEALIRAGRMRAPGRKAFEARELRRVGVYSYEQARERAVLPPRALAVFRKQEAAWAWWAAETVGYRRIASWYVISAKREETRARRLDVLIECCARGRRLGMMERP